MTPAPEGKQLTDWRLGQLEDTTKELGTKIEDVSMRVNGVQTTLTGMEAIQLRLLDAAEKSSEPQRVTRELLIEAVTEARRNGGWSAKQKAAAGTGLGIGLLAVAKSLGDLLEYLAR